MITVGDVLAAAHRNPAAAIDHDRPYGVLDDAPLDVVLHVYEMPAPAWSGWPLW